MAKVALITGAAHRIGREIAIHLAENGWNLAIHFNHSHAAAKQLKEELITQFPNGEYQIYQADFTNLNETETLIKMVFNGFGQLDLLVNNASVFEAGSIRNTSIEKLNEHFKSNFFGPFLLMRDYVKFASAGVIINLTDTRVTSNASTHAAYSLSKKALWNLTQMAALAFAPDFRVNAIAPGVTLPPEGKKENYLMALAQQLPLQKVAGVAPILTSIDYILENQNLTGQMLFCDSGEQLL